MDVLFLTDEIGPEAADLARLAGPGIEVRLARPDEIDRLLPEAGRFEVLIGDCLERRLLEAARGCRIVIIPYAGVPRRDRELLEAFPEITVLNCHYNAIYAAEHAWALLLAAAKRIVPNSVRLSRGDWSSRYEGPLSFPLAGRHLLLIGYGEIGRRLGRYGRAFGMRVSAVKRTPVLAPEIDAVGGIDQLPRLLGTADAIVVSLPATAQTYRFLSADAFARMKTGVVFVNVGRGSVVDEDAFFEAMDTGKIGAAGLDTWWSYPKDREAAENTAPSRHPLEQYENLVLSPHRASHVSGRERRRIESLAEIVRAVASGRIPKPVDRQHWY